MTAFRKPLLLPPLDCPAAVELELELSQCAQHCWGCSAASSSQWYHRDLAAGIKPCTTPRVLGQALISEETG